MFIHVFFYQFDQLLQEELKWLPFLLQNQIDWNVNSPNTAKSSPEEAEASASLASGEEADNHVTSYSPTKKLDESTSNTKAFAGCNRISDNTQTTTNQATAGDQVRKTVDYTPKCSYVQVFPAFVHDSKIKLICRWETQICPVQI